MDMDSGEGIDYGSGGVDWTEEGKGGNIGKTIIE